MSLTVKSSFWSFPPRSSNLDFYLLSLLDSSGAGSLEGHRPGGSSRRGKGGRCRTRPTRRAPAGAPGPPRRSRSYSFYILQSVLLGLVFILLTIDTSLGKIENKMLPCQDTADCNKSNSLPTCHGQRLQHCSNCI